MKFRGRIGTVMLVAFGLSCGDATGVELGDLAGTWTAQSVTFTNLADSGQSFDLIANGGSFSMTLTAEGDFTASFNFAQESETDVGTYTVVGSTLTISESGQGSPEDFQITRDGNNMTLVGTDSWDFDGDGTEEDSTIRIVLTR